MNYLYTFNWRKKNINNAEMDNNESNWKKINLNKYLILKYENT